MYTGELLDDVSNLYNWYFSLVENLNKEEAPQELIELVSERSANKQSELE